MGKLVVSEFITLDGVIEDPGGSEDYVHGGWTFEYDRGDDGNEFKLDELMEAEAQLFGRVTYEGFAQAWPSREGDFADKLNNDPKYVVSTSLTDPQWAGTTVLTGDVAAAVRDLKAQQDGELLVPGSGALVRWLLANDLVDQLDLLTYPVVIGQGTRLFPDSGPDVALDLVNSRTTSRGITIQTYRPLGRPEYVTSTVDPEHVMRDATSGRRS